MIYKKWKMAFSHDSFDEAIQKALKEFNVSTIKSLTPYQLKTLPAACTFLIALSIFCFHFRLMRCDSFGFTALAITLCNPGQEQTFKYTTTQSQTKQNWFAAFIALFGVPEELLVNFLWWKSQGKLKTYSFQVQMKMKMQIDGSIFSHEKIGRTASCHTQVRFTSFSLWKRLAHAQQKSRAAFCRGFSRGVNKLTTWQTRHTNDFVNAKSHPREKPLLAG